MSPFRERMFRHSALWVLSGSMVYGASQLGVLVLLARLGTREVLGQFALGLAVTAPIDMFTRLQLRSLLAADAAPHHGVSDYLRVRFSMSALAILGSAAAGLALGYNDEILRVIVVLAIAKGVEAGSDLAYGWFQRADQMQYVGLSNILRSILSVAAVGLAMLGWVLPVC